MTIKKLIFIIFLLIDGLLIMGQDPLYTQFYAAPLYVNPGFAGATQKSRAMFNNRYQWVKLEKPFIQYAAGVDHNFTKAKSGVGLLATYEKAGSAGLNSTTVAAQYAYRIDFKGNWHLRPGLQFGILSRAVDFNRLIFGDQIDRDGVSTNSLENLTGEQRIFTFDFSSGFVVHNDMVWLGYAAHHINRPNQSLTGDLSRLPMKSTLHGGVKIHLIDKMHRKDYHQQVEQSFSPAFIYRLQGKNDQLDLGAYYTHAPFQVGVWYRGIPIIKQNESNSLNHDAIAFLVGLRFEYFNIGYSYDYTLSSLGITNSAGSHELSLSFVFDTSSPFRHKDKITKREMVIPCPDF